MPTIDQLRVVTDLPEGTTAFPEPDMTYVVYPLYRGGVELPVARVIRRGEHLYAVSVVGKECCIAGDGADHAIRGRYLPRSKSRSAKR